MSDCQHFLRGGASKMNKGTGKWDGMPQNHHRRLAAQLAAQLPEEKQDALLVLKCLYRLVDDYMYPNTQKPNLTVVPDWIAADCESR